MNDTVADLNIGTDDFRLVLRIVSWTNLELCSPLQTVREAELVIDHENVAETFQVIKGQDASSDVEKEDINNKLVW